ncbi:MAG TPA: hypothetical protein VM865_00905 [Acidobacteriaceae bacterium]|jgi:hypothetical protein|nr:hypothetical protein [Acidobacteriaceae bacterium]
MDSSSNSSARRSEDIALDLLKFIAPHANVGRTGAASTGFGPPSPAKSEDQIAQLLELYARCRQAVESSSPKK